MSRPADQPTPQTEALAKVTAFLDKYGLANTSAERHQARKAALADARAAIEAQARTEALDVALIEGAVSTALYEYRVPAEAARHVMDELRAAIRAAKV
jgi:hypothetical protein